MPTTNSELTVSSDWSKPGTEDPSPPCREGWWIRWLCQAPKAVCPPYGWNGWRKADWVPEGSPSSKQWREQPLSVYHTWPNDHCQVAHMLAMGKLKRAAMVQTLTVEHLLLNTAFSMAPESRKHTPEHTPTHIKIQHGGRLNSEKQT